MTGIGARIVGRVELLSSTSRCPAHVVLSWQERNRQIKGNKNEQFETHYLWCECSINVRRQDIVQIVPRSTQRIQKTELKRRQHGVPTRTVTTMSTADDSHTAGTFNEERTLQQLCNLSQRLFKRNIKPNIIFK